MKRTITFLFLAGGLLSAAKGITPISVAADKNKPLVVFTENKGQVRDQNQQARHDIIFGGTSGPMAFHLRKNGISYQLSKATATKKLNHQSQINTKRKLPTEVVTERLIFRADIKWLNCNEHAAIQYDSQLEGVSHFYDGSSREGIRDVRSFSGVWYKEIYPKTDLHYYSTAGGLKYDFIVNPGGNYKNIKMGLEGCEAISINHDGTVRLKTPLGEIVEEAPVVFQENKKLVARWVLTGKTLSFDITGYNPEKTLVIDPITRLWGTYYGGTNEDLFFSITTDATNNVIAGGGTEGATGTVIATTGSHLQTYGGGTFDCMLAKFSSTGTRLWATYYGGSGEEYIGACATDATGNIIVGGYLDGFSVSSMTTAGCHQATAGGNYDGFLAKFSPLGVRLWGTIYGGSNDEEFTCVSTDNSGNIFAGGYTDSNNGISSSGAHQTTLGGGFVDGFAVKFDATGTRLWGTYYGGTGDDSFNGCDANSTGDVYFGGGSNSSGTGVISTSSAHQTGLAGQEDGMIVKFNSAGVRQWGTYIGGFSYDYIYGLSVDGANDVNVVGDTESSSGISSTGSHQLTYAGGTGDAWAGKFSPAGVRLWATYYGGNSYDDSYSCASDQAGNVYLAGTTQSSGGSAISTQPSFQSTFGGSIDVFLVKFSAAGIRQWGTYYGGATDEIAYTASDAAGDVYLGGYTDSGTGTVIASSNGHQPTSGGAFDGFIAKFGGCTAPGPATITTTTLGVCANKSATIIANAPGTAWYTVSVGGSPVASTNSFVPGVLPVGTYTYYAEAFDCMSSSNRTPVSLTVVATPTIVVASSNPDICQGESVFLQASGANSYTWAGLGQANPVSVTPLVTTTYTVIGGVPGCATTQTFVQLVSICTEIGSLGNKTNTIRVFPNPTTGHVVINSSVATEAQLTDVLGRSVSFKLNEGDNTLVLPDEKGIYFLRVTQNEKVITIKVIKE